VKIRQKTVFKRCLYLNRFERSSRRIPRLAYGQKHYSQMPDIPSGDSGAPDSDRRSENMISIMRT
jgi:hypothetical protein